MTREASWPGAREHLQGMRLLFAMGLTSCLGPPAAERSAPLRTSPEAGGAATEAPSSPPTESEGQHYLVAATTGRDAIAAGERVLEAGGNAMDAALTVALDQVVLSGGAWNSLAGIASLIYYDASNGEAHVLDAGFRAFADELEPMTIPGAGAPSGRTALVPGFMALVQAAADRFGTVPFASLFAPAISHAEQGVVVGDALHALFQHRQAVLTRLEATRQVYAPGGELLQRGELFVQPALAATLLRLAQEGAGYMYHGAWAEHFVTAVRAEGGRASLSDLTEYRVDWSRPRCAEYGKAHICSIGGKNLGGAALLESLLVADAAGLRGFGAITESSDALYWSMRALQVGTLLEFAPQLLPSDPTFVPDRLEGVGSSPDTRLEAGQAALLVAHVESGRWDQVLSELSIAQAAGHSDAIVVVDRAGNAVAMTHTINTENWGTTGLNVDGISIPDAAHFQQGALALAGPGGYLGTLHNPALVFESASLRLVASTIGNVHYAMFGHLRGWLDLGPTLGDLVKAPLIGGGPYRELVPAGSVPMDILARVQGRGLTVRERVDPVPAYWVGVELDVEARRLRGAVTPSLARFGAAVLGR